MILRSGVAADYDYTRARQSFFFEFRRRLRRHFAIEQHVDLRVFFYKRNLTVRPLEADVA
jgi:hypothetical protein